MFTKSKARSIVLPLLLLGAAQCGKVIEPDPLYRLQFRMTGDFRAIDSIRIRLSGPVANLEPATLVRKDSLITGVFNEIPKGFQGRFTADLIEGLLIRLRADQPITFSAARDTLVSLRLIPVDLLNPPAVWPSNMTFDSADSLLKVRWSAYPDSGEFRELGMFYVLVMDSTVINTAFDPRMGLSMRSLFNRADTAVDVSLEPGTTSWFRVFICIRRFNYYWPGDISDFFVQPG